MKCFKNSSFLLFALLFIGLGSCNKDCSAPDVSKNIVGKWLVEGDDGGEVEFKSDGSLIDPENVIFYSEINGVVYDQKSYRIEGDTTLNLIAMPSGGNGSSSHFRKILLNECDKIQYGFSGLTLETMTRQ